MSDVTGNAQIRAGSVIPDPAVTGGRPTCLKLADGWTACGAGPLRRLRRTVDPRKVTCPACRERLMA